MQDIESLHVNGSDFFLYPFKVKIRLFPHAEAGYCKVLVGVSKKRFKKSVERNLEKRHLRELYRLHAGDLKQAAQLHKIGIHVSFHYVADEHIPWNVLLPKYVTLIHKLTTYVSQGAHSAR